MKLIKANLTTNIYIIPFECNIITISYIRHEKWRVWRFFKGFTLTSLPQSKPGIQSRITMSVGSVINGCSSFPSTPTPTFESWWELIQHLSGWRRPLWQLGECLAHPNQLPHTTPPVPPPIPPTSGPEPSVRINSNLLRLQQQQKKKF